VAGKPVTIAVVQSAAWIGVTIHQSRAISFGTDHPLSSLAEMRRAAVMQAIATDDDLLEVLTARINQFMANQ
jgi:hypothetical protein